MRKILYLSDGLIIAIKNFWTIQLHINII